MLLAILPMRSSLHFPVRLRPSNLYSSVLESSFLIAVYQLTDLILNDVLSIEDMIVAHEFCCC